MKLARRIFLVLSVVALMLVGVVAAFYGIEDWRGAHAWAVCRQELEARGEPIDMAAFAPPAVADDKNLAMAPIFVRMYGYRIDPDTGVLTFPTTTVKNPRQDDIGAMPRGPSASMFSLGDWSTGQPLDLTRWQEYYRRRPESSRAVPPQSAAEDALHALAQHDPILDEMTRAMDARPRTRFPINWTTARPAMIALPHYSLLQLMTGDLRLRMAAHLALGHYDAAIRDFALARRLIDIPANDPVIIAQIVSETEAEMMLLPVWEGLRTRRWSGPELEQIKTGLSGLDYLATYNRTMYCERAFMCTTTDDFKSHGGAVRMISSMQGSPGSGESFQDWALNLFVDLLPGGWYDQNKVVGCRFYQDHLLEAVDVQNHHVRLAKAEASASAAWSQGITPYTWLVRIIVPIFDSVLVKTAACQADVDHAVIACALEQFYLDRHTYPTQLDELVPVYLDHVPLDVIDGAPTRYRLTSEGRYVLYSIGWNNRDDGGQIAWQQSTVRRDNRQGDWVWQYEPLQPPDKIQRNK